MGAIAYTDTLHTIAQIAITIIGFSGIVIVFGERAVSEWTGEERLRIYALITPTLTALFCSFVPILISAFSLSSDAVWRSSNAVLGLAHFANLAVFMANRNAAKMTLGQKLNGSIGAATILAHFLAAAGLVPWYIFVFLFGLLQQIWIGIHNFLLLFQPRMGNGA